MSVDTVTTVPVVIRLPHQVADATIGVGVHTDDATFEAILADHPGDVRVFPPTEGLGGFRSVHIDLDGQPTVIFGASRVGGPAHADVKAFLPSDVAA
jgi:hypothetical protein